MRRYFHVQREAITTTICRHDLHARFAAKCFLQNPARLARVQTGQGDIERDYSVEFSRGPRGRLSQ
jgi:hypothetical protein